MNEREVFDRLSALGLELPEPTAPLAAYVPCVVEDGFAWVAGQLPLVDGQVLHPGLLGEAVTVEEGAAAARRAALQSLAVLHGALGGFERLRRLVQVTVYVAAAPGFIEHPKVANGASELFADVLGDAGTHARAAVGVASLPLGACVEVAVTAAADAG